MIKVKVDDDKYTVFLPTEPQDHRNFRALRYGEEWRDLTGDNLIYNLAYELNEARAENARLRDALERLIYETTHLSPENNDGSHWCKISKETLERARAALGDKL